MKTMRNTQIRKTVSAVACLAILMLFTTQALGQGPFVQERGRNFRNQGWFQGQQQGFGRNFGSQYYNRAQELEELATELNLSPEQQKTLEKFKEQRKNSSWRGKIEQKALERLEFTPDQKQALKDFRSERQALAKTGKELMEKRKALVELLQDPNSSNKDILEKVTKLNKDMAEFNLTRVKSMLTLREALTPEQLRKINQFLAQRKGMMQGMRWQQFRQRQGQGQGGYGNQRHNQFGPGGGGRGAGQGPRGGKGGPGQGNLGIQGFPY